MPHLNIFQSIQVFQKCGTSILFVSNRGKVLRFGVWLHRFSPHIFFYLYNLFNIRERSVEDAAGILYTEV